MTKKSSCISQHFIEFNVRVAGVERHKSNWAHSIKNQSSDEILALALCEWEQLSLLSFDDVIALTCVSK
jgi:hypothetical protein